MLMVNKYDYVLSLILLFLCLLKKHHIYLLLEIWTRTDGSRYWQTKITIILILDTFITWNTTTTYFNLMKCVIIRFKNKIKIYIHLLFHINILITKNWTVTIKSKQMCRQDSCLVKVYNRFLNNQTEKIRNTSGIHFKNTIITIFQWCFIECIIISCTTC